MKNLSGSHPKIALLYSTTLIAGGLLALEASLLAGPAQLLSARNPSAALPDGANGDSVAPRISPDGRYVVFSSSASDLVTNDNGQFGLDVFLRDRSRNTTALISANSSSTGGGNGHSTLGQASAYGRYVVFQSDASDLVAGDTNGVSDIFIRDTFTGTTRLVSLAANGGMANGASSDPVMTPDGSCIAFISAASNLVAGDANGIPDVFARDLITQTTWLISVGARGSKRVMATPVITPDGRSVAFFSTASNLVADVPTASRGEIYVRDRAAGTTTWASTNAAATVSNLLHLPWMPSCHPALSDDGRYVAFKTGWTNGVTAYGGATVAAVIVFQYDLLNGTTTVVSTNGFAPWTGSDDVFGPEMTPDGRFIAYADRETAPWASNSIVRLWDQQTGTNVLVSTNSTWPAKSTTHTPAVSDDGRYVTFLSDAARLVPNVYSNRVHIYRRDLHTSTTLLVDTNAENDSTDQTGAIPSMSADGRYVAYATKDSGLPGSDNRAMDVLLRDMTTATNQLISSRHPLAVSQSGNGISAVGTYSFSADGDAVAFAGFASDLVTNDFNGDLDVFVRSLIGGTNILVSVGSNGRSAAGGSHSPLIGADGRFVYFLSTASNLVTSGNDTKGVSDVFRRDMQTGSMALVSVNSMGTRLGDYDSLYPVCSRDGRYAAFLCRTNVSSTLTNLYWRDMDAGLTRLAFVGAHPEYAISMSADGQRVAYFTSASRIQVWDAGLQANIYTNVTPLLWAAAIDPTGNRLLCQTASQLFVCDLVTSSNLFTCPSTVRIRGSLPWSGDGRYVAFVTASNVVAGDTNGINDVYLRDLELGTVTWISSKTTGPFSANGTADSPVVSLDGRFVAFRSFATDIVPGIVRPPSLVLYDRGIGAPSLLATGTTGSGASWVARPAFSADGAQVVFPSWDSGLVSADLNRAGDYFIASRSVLSPWDSDADGVPDWWMIQYFGHASGQADDLSRAPDDADGDGLNNLGEYLAGTIPNDPGSVLALSIATGTPRTRLWLGWDAVAGKTYQVLSTTNLSDPNWLPQPGTIQVSGSRRYLEVQAANSSRYFRVLCH